MQTIIRLGLAAAAMASALVCSTACNAAPTVESRSVHEIANSPARFVPALTGALPRTLLYVSTLSWSTGTGSVFVYDAYGKNSQPIGSMSISSIADSWCQSDPSSRGIGWPCGHVVGSLR